MGHWHRAIALAMIIRNRSKVIIEVQNKSVQVEAPDSNVSP